MFSPSVIFCNSQKKNEPFIFFQVFWFSFHPLAEVDVIIICIDRFLTLPKLFQLIFLFCSMWFCSLLYLCIKPLPLILYKTLCDRTYIRIYKADSSDFQVSPLTLFLKACCRNNCHLFRFASTISWDYDNYS